MSGWAKGALVALTLSAGLVRSTDPVLSQELVPLAELQADDIDGFLYYCKRCAAISLLISARTQAFSDKSLAHEMTKRYLWYSDKAGNAKQALKKQQGMPITNADYSAILDDIKRIFDLYAEKMDNNYALTGKMTSEAINSDMRTCDDIYKALSKK